MKYFCLLLNKSTIIFKTPNFELHLSSPSTFGAEEREKKEGDKKRKREREKEKEKERAKELEEELLLEPTADDEEMRKLLGFATFDSTKGKPVAGNKIYVAHKLSKNKYRCARPHSSPLRLTPSS